MGRKRRHSALAQPTQEGLESYFSQDEPTCGADVAHGCGPVSLANAFILTGATRPGTTKSPSPLEICGLAWQNGIFTDTTGLLRPEELRCLVRAAVGVESFERRVGCGELLAPGALLWVASVALKNLQGLCQFELATDGDSHIVVVESVSPEAVVVINPDTRPTSKCLQDESEDCECFEDCKCGRMHILRSDLAHVCHGCVMW